MDCLKKYQTQNVGDISALLVKRNVCPFSFVSQTSRVGRPKSYCVCENNAVD